MSTNVSSSYQSSSDLTNQKTPICITEEYLKSLFSSPSVMNKEAVFNILSNSASKLQGIKFGELKKTNFEEKIVRLIKVEETSGGIQKSNGQKEKFDKVKVLRIYAHDFFQQMKQLGSVELRKIMQIISTMWDLKTEGL